MGIQDTGFMKIQVKSFIKGQVFIQCFSVSRVKCLWVQNDQVFMGIKGQIVVYGIQVEIFMGFKGSLIINLQVKVFMGIQVKTIVDKQVEVFRG